MWKGLNVLIGVSGNGRYLTRLINQSGVKRLEARIAKRERQRSGDRERERPRYQAGAVCQAGTLSCLVLLPRVQSKTPTDTLAAVSVTHGHSTTGCKTRMQQ